jgi:hypothetical protein
MPPPLVVSLIVLVSLPMAPWASRITLNVVPETRDLDPRALAAFRAAAGSRVPVIPMNSPYPIGAATNSQSGYVWDLYASTAYVVETLNLFPDCGSSTSAGAMDLCADSRSRSFAVDIGVTGGARFANAGKFSAGYGKDGSWMEIANPGAPAGRWLRIRHGDMGALNAMSRNWLEMSPEQERLALCLIGILGIVPSLLRRRGAIGGKRAGTS